MSKVLVAVEGEEQAGAAARYLIDRARTSRDGFILIASVQPFVGSRRAVASQADLIRQICETAGPWLDDAGIRYEVRTRSGDLGDVVNEITSRESYDEIVIIARAQDTFKATLQRLLGLPPHNPVRQIAARGGIPVTLVQARPTPSIFHL